jgi:hypothetical protein
MQIPGTTLLLPASASTLREPLLQQLKPGQILQGTALSGNVDGRLSLQIGVARLIAQTELSVRPGQALTLQVVKTDTLPELRVLTLPSLQELKAAALKLLLPRQQPLPPAFEALTRVVQAPPEARIPPVVREQAANLLNQAPSAGDAGLGTRLQNALADSGLLTEAKLLLQAATAPADIKLNLVRLQETLRQWLPERMLPPLDPGIKITLPPVDPQAKAEIPDNSVKLLIGLLKNLDGAVARIQTHQLASLPQDDPGRQVWQFELPIRYGQSFDLFHFRIGRESAGRQETMPQTWNLTLHMNLSDLGPMRVQIRLQEKLVSTVIWSAHDRTDDLVRQHLERLRQGYERAGLEVNRLESYVGAVDEEQTPDVDVSLLHEKA